MSLRELAPGAAVNGSVGAAGFIAASSRIVREALAAFAGGGPDTGRTQVATAHIQGVRPGDPANGSAGGACGFR